MDRYVRWAKANLAESESLSDTDLETISEDASRGYLWGQALAIGILIFVYLTFFKDPLMLLLDGWNPWQRQLAALIGLMSIGSLIGYSFDTLIKRRLRAAIISRSR